MVTFRSQHGPALARRSLALVLAATCSLAIVGIPAPSLAAVDTPAAPAPASQTLSTSHSDSPTIVREQAAVIAQPSVFWPLAPGADITDGFGPRTAPTEGASTNHRGIDFAAPLGTPVRSVYDGVVISTQPNDLGSCGLSVEVAHEFRGHSIVTRYCHLETLAVQPGQQLSGGETLGTLGSSGVSTGPHLHFELMVDGTHIDPQDWLGNNTKGWL